MSRIGQTITKTSKQGGGSYVIVGMRNCSRCGHLIEEREIVEPNKRQRKTGKYYSQYAWCEKCGLYENIINSKIIL